MEEYGSNFCSVAHALDLRQIASIIQHNPRPSCATQAFKRRVFGQLEFATNFHGKTSYAWHVRSFDCEKKIQDLMFEKWILTSNHWNVIESPNHSVNTIGEHKFAKLVYNFHNYDLWLIYVDISIPMWFINQLRNLWWTWLNCHGCQYAWWTSYRHRIDAEVQRGTARASLCTMSTTGLLKSYYVFILCIYIYIHIHIIDR